MAQPTDVQRLREQFEGREGEILSVYLSVNAEFPENQRQAYLTRLKDALRELEVPDELADRVQETAEGEQPRARTLVFFAGEDGLFEEYRLQVDLEDAYRYGEPYLVPLVLALDEHEPYAVALFDAEEYRFFVTSPAGEAGEASGSAGSGFFREVDVSPSEPYPRGGMDQETESRRTEANLHEWYNELGELTRRLTFQEGARHLILAGPKERTAEFRETLPQDIRDRVAAEEPVATGAPEGEILKRLEGVREEAEQRRKAALLEEAREKGIHGVKDTIEALQEGRVYHLLVLWSLDGEIRWSDADALAVTDITQEKSPYSGEETRVRPLIDVLVDLAAARGARIEFVEEEEPVAGTPNEDLENTGAGENLGATLREEFDGLVGLLRY